MASKYEQRIQNYLASHPGATRAEARGHGRTPEHGGILTGTARKVSYPGGTIRRTYTDSVAERDISRAADHGSRVQLMVHTDDGWKTVGGSRGYSATYLESQIAAAGDLRSAVTGSFLSGSAGGSGGDSDTLDDIDYDDIDAWQVAELER